jgi:hypothetical protein
MHSQYDWAIHFNKFPSKSLSEIKKEQLLFWKSIRIYELQNVAVTKDYKTESYRRKQTIRN